jgi:hypothetical protein
MYCQNDERYTPSNNDVVYVAPIVDSSSLWKYPDEQISTDSLFDAEFIDVIIATEKHIHGLEKRIKILENRINELYHRFNNCIVTKCKHKRRR